MLHNLTPFLCTGHLSMPVNGSQVAVTWIDVCEGAELVDQCFAMLLVVAKAPFAPVYIF